MTESHPTLVVPAPDSLLDHAGDLAALAFGAFSDAGNAPSLAGPRHLAFLTPDALDLDLTDPNQRRFADYELEQKIGQGGMGVVYRARQASLDREVALKLLAAGPWASTDFIERFKREAQSAARMQHPNIVPIFEIGSQDGLYFFSMRLVRGPSLAQVLAEHGPMAPKRAAVLVRTLAEALDYAHRLGVLHLDLKPGNVLIDEHGEPQVADFGLSRRLDQTVQADSDEVSGTPSYMAPEQALARANRFSQATDIYGLGTILYEVLTGRPPFLAATAQETLQRVVADPPEAPRVRDRRIPADLEAICLKCLAKEPAERYRTARELCEELARFVDGRAVLVRPLNAAQRIARWARREPKFATAVLLVALSLLLGAGVATHQWRRAEAGTSAVRELLWSQRLDAAAREIDQHNPSAALPHLTTNLAEKEAAGESAAAVRERARIGALLAASPRLVAVHHLDALIGSVAIAPGGAAIALGTAEKVGDNARAAVVRFLDAATGRERWRRPLLGLSHFMADADSGNDYADQMQFTPDGSRLLVHRRLVPVFPTPHGMDMLLLDTATGEPLLPPPSVFPDFRDASYSPDGRLAILRDKAMQAQVFRVDGWQALGGARDLGFQILILGPVGRYAAAGAATEKTLDLYSVPGLEIIWKVKLDAGVSAWNFDPAGTTLVLGLTNGQVILVDCDARSLRALSPAPGAEIKAVRFVADGNAVIAISVDGSLMQWSLPTGTLRHRAIQGNDIFNGLAADRSGSLLASIGHSEKGVGTTAVVHLWRAPAVAQKEALADSLGRITTGERWDRQPLDLDGESGLIAVGTMSGTLSLWRVPAAAQRTAPAPPLLAATLQFDGRTLVAATGPLLWLADASSGQPRWPAITLPLPVGFAAFSDANDVLVATSGRTLYRFRGSDGASLGAPIELPNSPQRFALARDGRHAVASWLAYRNGRLQEIIAAYDLRSGQPSGEPVALPGPLLGMTIDREAKRLLTWRDATISVFELATMRQPHPPIELARTPTTTPGKPGAEIPGDDENAGLIDVVAAADGLVASRGLGDYPIKASLCRARLTDGAVLGCTAVPTVWNRLASNAPLRYAATSTGHMLRDDGSVSGYGAGAANSPDAIAMSADGTRLARVVQAGIELFDTQFRERVAPLLPVTLAPGDVVAQLAFAPDGRRLAGRSLAGRWLVWELPIEDRPVARVQEESRLLELTEIKAPLAPATAAMLARHDPGPPRQSPAPEVPVARWIDGLPVSPRSPEAPVNTLDLTASYNHGLGVRHVYKKWGYWKVLLRPDGVQRLLGVDYDVRGVIALGAISLLAEYPRSIRLALPQPDVAALHVLVAAPTTRRDRQALPYLHAILRYRDGSSASHAFLYVRDLSMPWGDDGDPQGTAGPPWTAWINYPSHHYDYLAIPPTISALRVENPHPDRAIDVVEFEAEAAEYPNPWILAVTVEPASRTPGTRQ